ncbi:molybdenum ABC transporter periplasmic molybdate-binding protein [Helicobacter pylori]|nr:molybdenum ABC transporter periplasmic molybdate-binding protein [Helicobacter pylori]BAW47187.1 molybdenum ABC transporter periplasmic molybdate-binding protein [Helicobacter pylori]
MIKKIKTSLISSLKALYSPIEQALIATKNGANNPLAKVFKDFLFSPKARAIFKEYGYIVD